MPKRKAPKKLTNDELAKKLFHPAVIEHVKQTVGEGSEAKPKRSSKTTLQES